MKGILLVNMGGAENEDELRFFLRNMFNDKHILPMPKFARRLLGFMISTFRTKKSWQKYELIGGSPLIDATKNTTDVLQKKLSDYRVKFAFSYSKPLIPEVIRKFQDENISDITVVPLYPHNSITTFDAVKDEIRALSKIKSNLSLNIITPYYKDENFILFWADLIQNHIKKNQYQHPALLFSAHSIPLSFVKKGDTYPEQIQISAKLIADACKLPYKFAYQSQMKGSKWLQPNTQDVMADLRRDFSELVLIPISFVSENLETLYDLDRDIVPFGKSELNFTKISRVNIDEKHPFFIRTLENKIKEIEEQTDFIR